MRRCFWARILLGNWLGLLISSGGLAWPQAFGEGSGFIIERKEGLPQNSVTGMIQTRDSYLWLGTLSGLVRFDGVQFTVFDESSTPGLDSSIIVYLFEDSRTNFWVGTETAGVVLIQAGRVVSLGIGRGSQGGRLAAACEDVTGAVWLYTADGQLWRYRDGTTNRFRGGVEVPSYYRGVIAEDTGLVWIGVDGRLWAVESGAVGSSPVLPVVPGTEMTVGRLEYLLASRAGGHWRLIDGRIQKWRGNRLERDWGAYRWTKGKVSAACEDREGNLVVGTQGEGVWWCNAEGEATCLSTNTGLSYNYILSLLVDREGTLWVGTDGGGLNRVKPSVFDVVEPFRGLVVQSVCEDTTGGFWVGSNGRGVGYWRSNVLERFYGPSDGLVTNLFVRAVYEDRKQRVWAGTVGQWAGLFRLQDGEFWRVPGPAALSRGVLAIYEDRGGQLWFGTEGGLVLWDGQQWTVFTTADGLSGNVVRAIAEDAEGSLWIGTVGGGMNQLRDGVFTSFRKEDGLPSENISSLYMDPDGVLWIGTAGGGLARYHRGQWARYSTRQGLVSNSIGYLIEDEAGYLWIGSYAGLMRVRKEALNDFARRATNSFVVRSYGTADGLPEAECTIGSQPGAWRSRDGTLWFPTIQGLASVHPDQLKPNPHPPPVMIESVLVDGQLQNTNNLRSGQPQSLVVPPHKERIEIHFTGLNLSAPRQARFKYRLQGHETDWIEAGNMRLARYSKLPPGHYSFQVTACNEDGIWNKTGSTLAVIIQPPFWRTWWFLSVAVGLFLGSVVAGVHYISTQKLQRQLEQFRQQEALERERSRIARDIHDQLGASLTQVALLGELVEGDKDAPVEVEAHARQISETARDTTRVLDEIVWTVNPSNDTLDGLVTYVCKYAQDYLRVAGLRYRLDVPSQLPCRAIPPDVRHNVYLAAKEAITNVVRHAEASAVLVRLRLNSSRFTLEIEDNGRGLGDLDTNQAFQTRNGLRNMKKRMEDIRGGFGIGPGGEGGTRVCLTVPLASP